MVLKRNAYLCVPSILLGLLIKVLQEFTISFFTSDIVFALMINTAGSSETFVNLFQANYTVSHPRRLRLIVTKVRTSHELLMTLFGVVSGDVICMTALSGA